MILYAVLITFLLLFVTTESRTISGKDALEPFYLEEFLRGTFSTRTFNGTWLSDKNFLFRRPSAGDYMLYDMETKNSSVLFNSTQFVFRHSTTALFAIYDIQNGIFYDVAEKEPCQIAVWAPVGHGLVYVRENNIYYIGDPAAEATTITTDGVVDVVYNGVPDWVYEEEVLGSGTALWFSPNGKQIAFASFNDTDVLEFKYFLYGTPGSLAAQYPTEVDIRYPKVGTKNPDVRTFIANLETGETFEFPAIPSDWLEAHDYVLYDMTWVSDEEVAVVSTNRVQNQGALLRCNIDGSPCVQEAQYSEEKGWLDPHIPKYSMDGTRRLEILPQPVGDDFFNHLVLTEVATEEQIPLTSGRYVVTNIYGWDEDNELVYFLGSREDEPSQRHVYVSNISAIDVRCLTCDMDTSRGPCLYAAASFSSDFSYITKICQGPGPYLVEVQSTQNDSDVILWEDNASLQRSLALKALPQPLNVKVPIANGTFTANVRMLLPPNLDERKKYPAVVYVYAGPDSNGITDAYSSGFQNYIVTNREYIYIYIDGRGSGRDGQNKMFQIYRKLGTVEIEDQIDAVKYLHQHYAFLDANKTGIWGWSYGGFAAAWALVQDTENVFKFGLSVAPVTSFIYYDTIYTERYMGLPTEEDNLEGYNNTDITRNVEKMRGKLYFLIHGNADDNVHYQQAMALARALEQADIPFRQQSYPDQNHGLGGVYAHLYHTIDRFWARSFGLPDPPNAKDIKEEEIEKKTLVDC